MVLRRLLAVGVLGGLFLVPSAALAQAPSTAAALAQASSTEPAGDAGCQAGELCGSGDRDDEPLVDNRSNAPDPAGNFVRSLFTLGLIGAVIGTYLFVALTGKNVFRRRRKLAA